MLFDNASVLITALGVGSQPRFSLHRRRRARLSGRLLFRVSLQWGGEKTKKKKKHKKGEKACATSEEGDQEGRKNRRVWLRNLSHNHHLPPLIMRRRRRAADAARRETAVRGGSGGWRRVANPASSRYQNPTHRTLHHFLPFFPSNCCRRSKPSSQKPAFSPSGAKKEKILQIADVLLL